MMVRLNITSNCHRQKCTEERRVDREVRENKNTKIKSFHKLLTTTSNSIKHMKNITRKTFFTKRQTPTNNFGIKIIDPQRVF